MEQEPNKHPVAITPPVEQIQQTRFSWRSLLLAMVISMVSAMISAYLTLERVLPKQINNDSSQMAQLAQTLRDDWHRQFEQMLEERKMLLAKVAKLNSQVESLQRTIRGHEAQLAGIRANTPTYATIKENLDHATKTDAGLQAQAYRILGDLGITDVRVRD